jgi:hypothetical protein
MSGQSERYIANRGMSMISLTPNWSSMVKSMPVQEFLDTVERVARVENW